MGYNDEISNMMGDFVMNAGQKKPSASPSGYACPLGKNEWRHNNGYVCCGSIRVFRTDIDTNPSEQFTKELLDWVISALNKA